MQSITSAAKLFLVFKGYFKMIQDVQCNLPYDLKPYYNYIQRSNF